MKKLRDIMRPDFLFTVQRDAMVTDAVRLMAERNVGIVIVLDGSRLVGVLSEVMTMGVIVAEPDDDYQSAIRQMDDANIRHLLVVRDGRMLSMVSIRDLIRVDIHDKSEELRYLREYLYQVPPDIAVRHAAA